MSKVALIFYHQKTSSKIIVCSSLSTPFLLLTRVQSIQITMREMDRDETHLVGEGWLVQMLMPAAEGQPQPAESEPRLQELQGAVMLEHQAYCYSPDSY